MFSGLEGTNSHKATSGGNTNSHPFSRQISNESDLGLVDNNATAQFNIAPAAAAAAASNSSENGTTASKKPVHSVYAN